MTQEQKTNYESATTASNLSAIDQANQLMTKWLKSPEGQAFWKANQIGVSVNPLVNSARGLRGAVK